MSRALGQMYYDKISSIPLSGWRKNMTFCIISCETMVFVKHSSISNESLFFTLFSIGIGHIDANKSINRQIIRIDSEWDDCVATPSVYSVYHWIIWSRFSQCFFFIAFVMPNEFVLQLQWTVSVTLFCFW